MVTQPTYFIPHGGGPCFFMEWNPPETWNTIEAWLRDFPAQLPERPKALLVISGHWEEREFTLGDTSASPALIYDYNGFPPHTYELTWPAAGAPELAERVKTLLHATGIPLQTAPQRGYDHGVFIPLKVSFPEADIPTLQLSLQKDLSPAAHIALGKALAPLRDEGVLIIGSGMSYHNMRGYVWDNSRRVEGADGFDQWLAESISAPEAERNRRLSEWAEADGGRAAHPREEHLIPLMVVAGAAGSDAGRVVLHDYAMGAPLAAYRFG